MSDKSYALAIHGGAGPKPGRDYARVEIHLTKLLEEGEKALSSGAASIDVVEELVSEMETSGLYVAGRGAPTNRAGYVELDASIMDGTTQAAGGIALAKDIVNPIQLARRVMDKTRHVLLAGNGAMSFAQSEGVAMVEDPDTYYILPVGVRLEDLLADDLAHGTVGCVARDHAGRLAAATSTGGIFGKMEGRIGDTPLIGSGTWADAHVAVSCTGLGEYFIRAGGAASVAARMRFLNVPLQEAVDAFIADVGALGGNGGVIAVSASGEVATAMNSHGMKRATAATGLERFVGVF